MSSGKKSSGPILFLLIAAVAAGGIGWWWFSQKPADQPVAGSPKELTVLSFGGTFAEAQREAYFAPYGKAQNVTVKEAEYNGEYGKLKAAVQSGSVSFDVVDVESSALVRGKKENLFEPIDYSVIDKSNLIPAAVDEHGVGADIYSVSLGFNSEAFPDGGPQPSTWKDFWDVQKFPGPRALKDDPRFTLEIALLADGVTFDELYAKGLDVDRALKSLDKIRPHVKLWWSSGVQPLQALESGEVKLAAAFGARMWIMQHRDNKPVRMTWNESIADIEYFAVLKGAKSPSASMQFIAFATKAEPQAAFSKKFPLGPVNNKAFDHLDKALASKLNTHPDNLKLQVFLDSRWWAENEEKVSERFREWKVTEAK